MKELSLYHKIAFAVLCLGAFTNTFLLLPQVTFLRLGVVLMFCGLLFFEKIRLDSGFYAVAAFFTAYIAYTLLLTLLYGRAVTISGTVNFFFILLLVIASLWLFCAAPRQSMRFFYIVCGINLVVSTGLAGAEMLTGWHLPMSNMHLPEKVMIVAEHNQNYPTGFFNNKNDFAIVVLLSFCYWMAYRLHFIKERKRWADFLFLGLCVACLCMTRCRTSIIGLFLFCLFLQRGFILKHKTFFGIAGGLCLVAFLVVFLFFADHSISIRQKLYLYSFASLYDSYGLGFGLDGDKFFYASFDNYGLFGDITNSHSYLLDILLTSGLFFFVGYLFLLFYLMRRIAVRHGRNEFWAMIPLYVFLLFAPSSANLLWIHYLFFASIAGYACLPANEERQKMEVICG
ncbi:MAG: O-antigen ligase family protein [Bacteroidales bacterium]|nr:O-antigen ligase family protein [Bacteroidales bacterium]